MHSPANSSFSVISNKVHSGINKDKSGIDRPVSHFDTALSVMPSFSANWFCVQPFACLQNHVTGKGMIKEIRKRNPQANIVAIDYDPGASEVNQINRLKLMMATAFKNQNQETK